MRSLRFLLSIAVASWLTGFGQWALAQETTTPFSITLEPLQFADVKGNVGKFQALNWMKSGADAGVGDIAFVKDINKDTSLGVEGSFFPKTDNNDAYLTLTKGDLAFLKIDYKSFRKYFDNTGGVYPGYNTVSGVKANSPDLQLDISYFKLEAGLGPISDPFVDVAYEHNSKDGDKSLLQWATATSSLGTKYISPAWEGVNDTVDRITLKENKKLAGVTFKAQQTAEIDYNHNLANAQSYVYNSSTSTFYTYDNTPDAKLFGTGVRAEKWMLNDNTFAAVGYHYNHISDTNLYRSITQTLNSSGVVTATTAQTGWNYARGFEDDHVWVGNLNTNLRPDLIFIADARYEHMGSAESSAYASTTTTSTAVSSNMDNHQDLEGEHVALRYSGIPHTSLYAESDMQQERNWEILNYNNFATTIERIARTQKVSWTAGMDINPNRFFTIRAKAGHSLENINYDTVSAENSGATSLIFLDALRTSKDEVSSTVTWKPYRWVQNSLKYQFVDTIYNPQASANYMTTPPVPSGGQYPIAKNQMLSSVFTYDINVEPTDRLLLMLTYSHTENYIRTLAASETGATNYPYIPTFNSGDNSWFFSDSYSPIDNLTWTNTVCYTISPNYVSTTYGIPLGSDFRMLNFTTGLEWTYHKWLKLGPSYEHAGYRDNALAGAGNYSANIFMLNAQFKW